MSTGVSADILNSRLANSILIVEEKIWFGGEVVRRSKASLQNHIDMMVPGTTIIY